MSARSDPVPVAENDAIFRLARLTLLLRVVEETDPAGIDLERLGIYGFLAAHPLLVASGEADPDRTALLLAGFDDRALSYASPAQRYAGELLRLPHDVTQLVAYGLATCEPRGRIRYRLTPAGHDLAGQITARYAHSYTAAARIVVRRLRRLSGRKLRDNVRTWLSISTGPPHRRLDPADVIDPVPEVAPSNGTAMRTSFPEDET
jgi:hypothetical protein